MALSVVSFSTVASGWFNSTTPRSITGVAWSAGDIIVVIGGAENANGAIGTPTNANLTFGAAKASSTTGAGNECEIYVWASDPAAGAQTGQAIAATKASGSMWGMTAWVITGGPSGIANATANLTESAISRTVTAGSVVVYGLMDWNATNPPNKTPATGSGTATERLDQGNTSNYAQYLCEWVGTAAGTFSFGPNSYTSLQVAQVIIEVLAGGGGPTTHPATGVSAGAAGTGTSSATVKHSAIGVSAGGGSTGVATAKIKHAAVGVSAGAGGTGTAVAKVEHPATGVSTGAAGTGTSSATVIPGGGGATTHPATGVSIGGAGTGTSTAKVKHAATAVGAGAGSSGTAVAKVRHHALAVSVGAVGAGVAVALIRHHANATSTGGPGTGHAIEDGFILVVSPLRVFRIRAETRSLIVDAEDRRLTVKASARSTLVEVP